MIFHRGLLCVLILFGGCLKTSTVIGSADEVQSPLLNNEILEKLYNEHISDLQYTQIAQDPFVITFSGMPGMGKSFLSQKLAERYHAVRIRTDDIRDRFKQLPDIDPKNWERALKEYLMYMLQRYNFPNRCFILDASIDRSYIQLFPYLEKHNIPFLVIRLDVPREVIIDRIIQREGSLAQNYLTHLDRWFESYEEFGKKYKNYFLFKNVPDASLDVLTHEIDSQLKYAKVNKFTTLSQVKMILNTQ